MELFFSLAKSVATKIDSPTTYVSQLLHRFGIDRTLPVQIEIGQHCRQSGFLVKPHLILCGREEGQSTRPVLLHLSCETKLVETGGGGDHVAIGAVETEHDL